MTAFTADDLDLASLPAPSLVDDDYAAILRARLDHLVVLWEERRAVDARLPRLNTLVLKSEPGVILTQEYAYGDALLRTAINDTADALRLATSLGADLDHIAGTYHRTKRLTLIPADPLTGAAAVREGDEEYRARAQLAPEGLAEFGLTPGGYVYRIRSAFGDRIKSVRPIKRGGGRVEIRVLGRDGDGTVPDALIAEIVQAFTPEEASQSTDILTILSAEVVHYTAQVVLAVPRGVGRATVEAAALAGVSTLGFKLHRLGASVFREAISSAAHVAPVVTVRVPAPVADILGRPEMAPYLDGVTVSSEVDGEVGT